MGGGGGNREETNGTIDQMQLNKQNKFEDDAHKSTTIIKLRPIATTTINQQLQKSMQAGF